MNVLISNPPFNLKWKHPNFVGFDERYIEYGVPPESNANFAFIETGLNMAEKSYFILPQGVLTPGSREEKIVLKNIIDSNLLDSVILLPEKMFESTPIAVCILCFDKNRKTQKVEFIDARGIGENQQREQRGQFGGNSHENRVYKKAFNILSEEAIAKIKKAAIEKIDEDGFSKAVSISDISKNEYSINPSKYIDFKYEPQKTRSFSDIATDFNRIVKEKNNIKITTNETLAKTMGIFGAFQHENVDLSNSFGLVGEKVLKEDFISFTKSAVFKIEIKTNDGKIPELILLFINMWKSHIMYLNNEENRILAEFRDQLLPKLMNGEIDLNKLKNKEMVNDE